MPPPSVPLEKLATVDVLSGGRLNPGMSVGPPMRWDDVKEFLYPDTADAEDLSYERVTRLLRTANPQGPGRLLLAPDLVGPADQIAELLYAHASFREVREVAFALPFSFAPEDYGQILRDIAEKLGPALGWQPGRAA